MFLVKNEAIHIFVPIIPLSLRIPPAGMLCGRFPIAFPDFTDDFPITPDYFLVRSVHIGPLVFSHSGTSMGNHLFYTATNDAA